MCGDVLIESDNDSAPNAGSVAAEQSWRGRFLRRKPRAAIASDRKVAACERALRHELCVKCHSKLAGKSRYPPPKRPLLRNLARSPSLRWKAVFHIETFTFQRRYLAGVRFGATTSDRSRTASRRWTRLGHKPHSSALPRSSHDINLINDSGDARNA